MRQDFDDITRLAKQIRSGGDCWHLSNGAFLPPSALPPELHTTHSNRKKWRLHGECDSYGSETLTLVERSLSRPKFKHCAASNVGRLMFFTLIKCRRVASAFSIAHKRRSHASFRSILQKTRNVFGKIFKFSKRRSKVIHHSVCPGISSAVSNE